MTISGHDLSKECISSTFMIAVALYMEMSSKSFSSIVIMSCIKESQKNICLIPVLLDVVMYKM